MHVSGLGLLNYWCLCSGWHAQEHMEDNMASSLGLQRTSGPMTEDEEYNRVDKSPDWALAASVRVSGHTEMDTVSQWTLEGFSQPWSNKTSGISQQLKSLKQYPQNILLHITVSKMTSSGHAPSLSTDLVRQMGATPSFQMFLSPNTGQKGTKGILKTFYHLPSL